MDNKDVLYIASLIRLGKGAHEYIKSEGIWIASVSNMRFLKLLADMKLSSKGRHNYDLIWLMKSSRSDMPCSFKNF